MMPQLPAWWDMAIFILSLSGFVLLALASEREGKLLLCRMPTMREKLFFRLLGWPLLALALVICVKGWHGNFGTVIWFGWLTMAATVLVFIISYWPWRKKPPEHKKHSFTQKVAAEKEDRADTVTTHTRQASLQQWGRRGILILGLAAIPAWFGWTLFQVPVQPLLRADVVHGQAGPWTFVLAEEEQEPPEMTPSGTPVKHIHLRFCEQCDAQIRTAYLRVRQPRSQNALGLRFTGDHWNREAVLAIPPAATLQDQIWLTVVGKNRETYQVALDMAQVSPATVQFIQERRP